MVVGGGVVGRLAPYHQLESTGTDDEDVQPVDALPQAHVDALTERQHSRAVKEPFSKDQSLDVLRSGLSVSFGRPENI